MAIPLRNSAGTGMTLSEMKRIVDPLKERYDLDFTLGLSSAMSRYGVCKWRRKIIDGEWVVLNTTILISREYAAHGLSSDIKDTLLHEVAHALAGPSAGHGPLWQGWCVEIGAKPIRCRDKDTAALSERKKQKARVIGACRCAKDKHTMTRVPKRVYTCRTCKTKVIWTSK